jgi:hypothetical protein
MFMLLWIDGRPSEIGHAGLRHASILLSQWSVPSQWQIVRAMQTGYIVLAVCTLYL